MWTNIKKSNMQKAYHIVAIEGIRGTGRDEY